MPVTPPTTPDGGHGKAPTLEEVGDLQGQRGGQAPHPATPPEEEEAKKRKTDLVSRCQFNCLFEGSYVEVEEHEEKKHRAERKERSCFYYGENYPEGAKGKVVHFY